MTRVAIIPLQPKGKKMEQLLKKALIICEFSYRFQSLPLIIGFLVAMGALLAMVFIDWVIIHCLDFV